MFPKAFQNVSKIILKTYPNDTKISKNALKWHQNAPPVKNLQKAYQKVIHFAPTWLPTVTFGEAFCKYFRHVFPMHFLMIF